MPVATFTQPDVTAQDAATYKSAIDASVKVMSRQGQAFAPHQQTVADMTVRIDAGPILSGSTLTEVAAQSTGAITAPIGNPRIDRVVLDAATGAASVVTGTPAASPAAPAIPSGKLPCAQVLLQITSTSITNTMITDERASPIFAVSTSTSFAENSDSVVATQKAVKTYVDNLLAANDAMVYKGAIDCSANPNYPAADAGHTYRISVAGIIGGAGGVNVEAGDYAICNTDATASGDQATVGAYWNVIQVNVDGAVTNATAGGATDGLPAVFDGATGRKIKVATAAAIRSALALVPGTDVQAYDADLAALAALALSAGAKGTIFVLTAASTAVKKAIGADGTILMCDSSQSDGLLYTDQLKGKNLLYNGARLLDQINEGALYTVNSGGVQTVDGVTGAAVGGGVFKVRRLADPDYPSLKCLEITCTTADASIGATDNYHLEEYIEGYDVAALRSGMASAKSIVISFDMKSSVAGDYGISIRNSAVNRSYVGVVTQNVANTRESKTVKLTLDTSGTWLYDSGAGLILTLALAMGSTYQTAANTWTAGNFMSTATQCNFMSSTSNIMYLGRIKLEEGSVETPWHSDDMDYAKVLAKGQRYARLKTPEGAGLAPFTTGCDFNLSYSMRAAPSVSQIAALTISNVVSADFGQSGVAISVIGGQSAEFSRVRLGNFTGLTAGASYIVRNPSTEIYLNARLS